MRWLIIGRTGQLGSELIKQASGIADVYAPERTILDIESSESVEKAIGHFQPDLVINTAAYHNVPRCEIETDRAFAVNFTAVRNLARLCRDGDVRFITFSTDYVFSGEKGAPNLETDCPAPLQSYGISKLAGELGALATHPLGAYVVRTCGIYGLSGARSKGGNFIDNRIADVLAGKALTIANEQIVSPTYAKDLAAAVISLMTRNSEPGVYHLVNEGCCSWFELTRKTMELLGLEADIQAIDRGGLDPSGFRRPLFSAMENRKAKGLGIVLPPWEDALRRYLEERHNLARREGG